MKILLLGFAKIKYTPYANFYLDNIDRKKHSITFLYWNRDCLDEPLPFDDISYCEFKCYQEDNVAKWKKLFNFLKFKFFAEKHIRENKYDFIVVLSTLPGVLLEGTLKKYSGRYIFDYRDVTYEKHAFFRKKVHRLIQSSAATFISSDGFREYLPKADNIFTTHNLLLDSLNHRDISQSEHIKSNKIRISFWGLIRPFNLNLALIKKMAGDVRFELHYYGREQDIALKLKDYVVSNNIENVFFHGEYAPQDRYEFVKYTDIINNLHSGAGSSLLMANRYYDGALFRIPQICTKDSFMASCAERAGIGIGLDPESPDFVADLLEYYNNIEREKFILSCDKEAERFVGEYNKCAQIIHNIIE